jgi:hypothetical protein
MTAVTVSGVLDGEPAHEYVILTITEAYTYQSKLSKVFGISMTSIEDVDGYRNAVISGANTITFHTTGSSGKKVFCDIVGRL